MENKEQHEKEGEKDHNCIGKMIRKNPKKKVLIKSRLK